jgi:uncharacterized membrane protein
MSYARWGLALSGWVALAATLLPDGLPPRVIIALVFVLLCPGAAAVRLGDALLRRSGLRIDRLEAFVLSIALSLAIGALVAEAFFLTASYTTTRAMVALAAFTSVGALCPGIGHKTRAGQGGVE